MVIYCVFQSNILLSMPENVTVGQRFAHFIAYLGISKNAFAASLDKTATVIQHLVDERNKPGFDLLCKVFEVYPNLSKDWLLQGNGPMLAGERATTTGGGSPSENSSAKPTAAKEKPPVAAAVTTSSAASTAEPAADISSVAPEPLATSSEPTTVSNATASQPPTPATPEMPAAAPVTSVDTSWQTALYTQQMAHQLAMAELRNQHLQEQQRLMQQMLDLMQRKM